MVSALNSGSSSQVSRPVIGCVLGKRTLIYSVSPTGVSVGEAGEILGGEGTL